MSNNKFEYGDFVAVRDKKSSYYGKKAVVMSKLSDGYRVRLVVNEKFIDVNVKTSQITKKYENKN